MAKQAIQWKPHDIIVLHNKGDKSLLLQLPTGPQRLDKDQKIMTEAVILDVAEVKNLVDSGVIEVLERKAYPTYKRPRRDASKGG